MIVKNIFGARHDDSMISPATTSNDGSLTPAENELTTSSDDEAKHEIAFTWPIERIYFELRRDYMKKGYEDALVNGNVVFRDMNKDIISNKILLLFKQVRLRYSEMQSQLQTQMSNCEQMGLFNDVAKLKQDSSIIEKHLEDLDRLENGFRSGENEGATPLKSYDCGFLRGVSSQTMSVTSSMMHAS